MVGGNVAWGLSPSLVGLAQKTISRTRVPRVSFQRSSFVIAYLVCVTQASCNLSRFKIKNLKTYQKLQFKAKSSPKQIKNRLSALSLYRSNA